MRRLRCRVGFWLLTLGATFPAQAGNSPRPCGHSLQAWQNLDSTRKTIEAANGKLRRGEALTQHDRVRIAFYGQSLCVEANAWARTIVPNALKEQHGDIFTFIYKARGRWVSSALLAVYREDIEPADADLVIIHDYPSPTNDSYAALLFGGCADQATADRQWKDVSERDRTRYHLAKAAYDRNIGKPGMRQMINSRGNQLEVLLLGDHYVDTQGRDFMDPKNDRCSFEVYPKWAREERLGYLDLRSAWKRAIEQEHGNLSPASRNQFLTDGTHIIASGVANDPQACPKCGGNRRISDVTWSRKDHWQCRTQ